MLKLPVGKASSVFLKMESDHPTGSVKERPAFHMIKTAIEKGQINEETRVLEASSGNTGIGIARACKLMKLPCTIFLPENTPELRIEILRILGADLVFTPSEEGMKGSIEALKKHLQNSENIYHPDQFSNPANPEAHYLTTGPEIWEQTNGNINVLVAGSGSGGTISGCSRFLKEKNPSIRTIALEPEQTHVLRGGEHAPHEISGIAPGFVPENFHRNYIDEIMPVSEMESLECVSFMRREFNLRISASSGANIAKAIQLASLESHAVKNIITFVCENADFDSREATIRNQS
ncbi:MAG: cysteine synthase family protein [Bacteroidales bacterium]|nr:cysteine synthase family protein [Bacteroidales bacterium]